MFINKTNFLKCSKYKSIYVSIIEMLSTTNIVNKRL